MDATTAHLVPAPPAVFFDVRPYPIYEANNYLVDSGLLVASLCSCQPDMSHPHPL